MKRVANSAFVFGVLVFVVMMPFSAFADDADILLLRSGDAVIVRYGLNAAPSTGMIENFLVSPEDYTNMMKTLSIFAAQSKELLISNEIIPKNGEKEKGKTLKDNSLQEIIGELLGRLPSNILSSGTGWVWRGGEHALIATNHHVISGGKYFRISFPGGAKAVLRLLGSDAATDIALLEVVSHEGTLPYALMVDTTCQPQNGDEVVSIGYPDGSAVSLGTPPSWHMSYGRFVDSKQQDSVFLKMQLMDNNIIPGFSGGPTLAFPCGVIGINRQREPSRIIPANVFVPVLEALLAHGKVSRGLLGIGITTVGKAIDSGWFIEHGRNPAEYPEKGIFVTEIYPNTPAVQSGLRPGDVVIAVSRNGSLSNLSLAELNPEAFQLYVADTLVGNTIRLKIWRDGKELDIAFEVGDRNETKVNLK